MKSSLIAILIAVVINCFAILFHQQLNSTLNNAIINRRFCLANENIDSLAADIRLAGISLS